MSSEQVGRGPNRKELERLIRKTSDLLSELKTRLDEQRRANNRIHRVGVALGVLGLVLGLAALTSVAIAYVNWARVWPAFEPFWAQLLGVGLIVAGAIGLYRLRTYRPRYYATLEATVAMTSGWMAFSSHSATETGLKLAAAVYLLVRSFDNWNRLPPIAMTANAPDTELVIED